jgi:putative oxidoreductase
MEEIMAELDVALLLLRVWVGVVIVAHGINHGRTLEGTARWFESKGFRSPALNARMSAGTEMLIGLGMFSGLLMPVVAAGMVATMFVAFWTIHRFAGFYVFRRPDEGYEYVVTLTVICFVLGILGAGSASLDSVFGIQGSFDGWLGAGIVALGIVAGAVQLAVFWRRPPGAA